MLTPRFSETGSSLIEVLVALLIFSVGILGLSAMQLNALRGVSDSSQRSQATWIMQDIAERIRANPDAAAESYTATPNCATLPAKMCADHFKPGTGKISAANCSTDELAVFDRWEAQCSYAGIASFNTIDGRFSSRDFLTTPPAGAALTVSAIDPSNPQSLSIQSAWRGQGDDAKGSGSDTELSIGASNALEVLQ